jgi:hypothetical protein
VREEERWLEETTAMWAARGSDFTPDRMVWARGQSELDATREQEDRRVLCQTGTVRLALPMLADDGMWAFGTVTSWVEVIFRETRHDSADMAALNAAAGLYLHLRRSQSTFPGLAEATAFCQSGRRPRGVRRLPPAVAQGKVIQHATLNIAPSFLPGQRLDCLALPILVSPSAAPRSAMLLPHRWWAPELVKRWMAAR